MIQDFECPECRQDIELNVRQCNSVDICPICKVELIIEYDSITLDDGDIWDLYDLKTAEK